MDFGPDYGAFSHTGCELLGRSWPVLRAGFAIDLVKTGGGIFHEKVKKETCTAATENVDLGSSIISREAFGQDAVRKGFAVIDVHVFYLTLFFEPHVLHCFILCCMNE